MGQRGFFRFKICGFGFPVYEKLYFTRLAHECKMENLKTDLYRFFNDAPNFVASQPGHSRISYDLVRLERAPDTLDIFSQLIV